VKIEMDLPAGDVALVGGHGWWAIVNGNETARLNEEKRRGVVRELYRARSFVTVPGLWGLEQRTANGCESNQILQGDNTPIGSRR
jgi:hypothetical protein